MKKFILLFFLLSGFIIASNVQAQDYQSAIGLRFGSPFAASYKFFVSEPGAVELYLGFSSYYGYGGFNMGGMYQHHFPIKDVDGLQWYVGGGASINFLTGTYTYSAGTSFGINAAVGLDYSFADTPINLSLDFLPTFLVSGYGDGYQTYWAISARYILKS